MATLPRTASEAASTRKDPAPRPVSGVPARGLEVANKNPDRRYVMVDKGAGGGREVICPAYYEQIGYVPEFWPAFEGLKTPAELAAAGRAALHFKGRPLGRPGEPMEAYGAVLMSIDEAEYRAMEAAEQKAIDPIEEAIVDPDKARASYLREARAAARNSPIGVSTWEDQ